MSAAGKFPSPMRIADFLAWNSPDDDRWELVDGVPRAMSPARPRHAAIWSELGRLIGNHLIEHRPQCRVFNEAGVRSDDYNVRVPDLSVTCVALGPEDRLLPEPLLIVEVLSPSNKAETLANVQSYTTIPSVREIVVLHTSEVRADVLRRGERGAWPNEPETLVLGDSLTLESIGFSAPLASVYRTA